MRTKITASVLAAAIAMTGCANMTETQKHTTTGAGLGAAAGAIIGAVTGPGGWTRAIAGAGIGALVGGGTTYLWSSRMDKQADSVVETTKGTGVEVARTENDMMQISIPSDISFASSSYDLKPGFRRVLDRVATNLKDFPDTRIVIAGHTDSSGTDAINNPLSLNRAAAVRDYLVSQGVDARRIRIEGLGSRYPIADNSTPDGRARNRRVEIYVGERAS